MACLARKGYDAMTIDLKLPGSAERSIPQLPARRWKNPLSAGGGDLGDGGARAAAIESKTTHGVGLA